ncbi:MULTISPECIES: Fic/DOC family protein [unclassified Idiomarina]|jgi:cell filamentation protein|uniref:Fic/DOC family protein n=2 Tax=Idiomarina TaxID=135575 RepID=UPI00257BF2BE|nr:MULTISPECIES: Fic family protein [unclassified Idiomarina]|tara:strand:+ start:17995 stop:18588 length:594 start_codon:yes stop_codon:yes gene_type:complete
MRDKYGVAQDKYCYPETDVLTNLLDIRNADKLAEAEIEFTAERYRLYQSPRATIQQFTFEHLKKLHHHLFQDVYEWAGEVRDVDISKGETRFCTCTRIEPEAKKLFKNISQLENAQSHELFIEQIADLFCEINLLHPFREGNGRVQRFFFEEMLFALGYDVTWPLISRQEWVEANIAGVNLDLTLLKNIFNQAITEL